MNSDNNTSKISVVFTGGGTAGHILPHFALFEHPDSILLQNFQKGILDVHYIGSYEGMEKKLVEERHPEWKYKGIATGKLRRYFSWQNFIDPFYVVLGFFQAFFYLKKIKPRFVFSKGGFVAAPVVWAAWLLKIPVIIHESDYTPALATRLTAFFAKKILTAFEKTKELFPKSLQSRVECVGIPLRYSLFTANKNQALSFFSLDPARKTLLVFGGSLGALSLNEKFRAIIPHLADKLNIIHIVGKGKTFTLDNPYPYYRQFEFLNEEMGLAYAACDLALCRAGASSIFELAAARIPMILVPLPATQSRGDQIVNAKFFAQKGWAVCLEEETLTPEKLIHEIQCVLENLDNMRAALQTAPASDAAQKIATLVWEISAHGS